MYFLLFSRNEQAGLSIRSLKKAAVLSNGFQTFLKSSSKKIDPQGSIFFGLSEFAAFPSADGEEVYVTDKGSSLYHA